MTEPKTMFSIKSEQPDVFDVSNDSQHIRCMDDNPHSSDTSNTNTLDNWRDISPGEKLSFTIAYVKNESTSNALNNNISDFKGNEVIHGQNLIGENVMKTEKIEACTENTPVQTIIKNKAQCM